MVGREHKRRAKAASQDKEQDTGKNVASKTASATEQWQWPSSTWAAESDKQQWAKNTKPRKVQWKDPEEAWQFTSSPVGHPNSAPGPRISPKTFAWHAAPTSA